MSDGMSKTELQVANDELREERAELKSEVRRLKALNRTYRKSIKGWKNRAKAKR